MLLAHAPPAALVADIYAVDRQHDMLYNMCGNNGGSKWQFCLGKIGPSLFYISEKIR